MTRIDSLLFTGYPELAPDTPIRRAAARLSETGSTAAPVLGPEGQLAGILTQKDCFRAALHASYYQEWRGTVADHMTSRVHTLPVMTDLTTAATAFLEHPHRVFPVLDGESLVGLLRREDVLAALLSLG